jgi:peptide/nickel transport system permease protein
MPGTPRLHPLIRFALRRIALALLSVVLVSMLVFASTQVLPGDAASAILGRSANAQQKAIYRHELGLDKPMVEQYWTWASGVLTGDLGKSLASRQPVGEFISARIGNSLILAAATMAVLVPVALALGVWAGIRRNTAVDHAVSGISLGLIALPEFVTGTLLIAFLAVYLGWFPPTSILQQGETGLTSPQLIVLPVLTLCITAAAYIIRMVRAGIGEVMTADYIHMARLNGVPERRVIWRHGVRNALAPTVQVLALTAQYLVGGLVVVETVFAYPGIGQGLVQAVVARDIPVVQGIGLLLAALYIAINIVADLIVVLLVPRLRTSQ